MKYLFIAEKPSLMREVQACYRSHQREVESKVGKIIFTALAGHVCELNKPDEYKEWADKKWDELSYPMIPDKWQVNGKKDKAELLRRIKSCLKECNGIIVGTDSDIEGYGIYWMLEQYLGLSKYKTLRFVEHSLTEKEILDSLLSMTDYHADPVHTAATSAYLVRSRADWLFGMNGTRIMSVKKDTLLKVGRVKAATLGIVYNNSMAIENFKPEEYYQMYSDYGKFHAVLLDEKGKPAVFKDPPQLDFPLRGRVLEKKSKRVFEHAPKLFDLTTLQAEAGRVYHYSPAHTLQIVQSLYEKHKVISYPRTQCSYVSSEKAKEFPMMLSHMTAFTDLGKIAEAVTEEAICNVTRDRQVVNDTAVAKESHDALLPTAVKANPANLTEEETNICHMIYARLLAQFLPKTAIDKTSLVIGHGKGKFGVNGRMVAEQGWRILFSPAKDALIPEMSEGDGITAIKIGPAKKITKPPKRLDQATLVYAMKNIANVIEDEELRKTLSDSQGIGTPATRAGIIKELLDSQYMEEKKGGLFITALGKNYVESLEGTGLTSPEFAARLDLEMKRVQYRETTYEEAYSIVVKELRTVCQKMMESKAERWNGNEINASCPRCGHDMDIGKYSYNCSACGLKISRVIAGKKIDQKVLDILKKKKITPKYKFRKQNGDTFQARLKVTENENLEFDFSSGIQCPSCGRENITLNRGGVFCECGFKVYRKLCGHTFTDRELEQLVNKGRINGITDFISKKGDPFSADVIIEKKEVKLCFENNNGKKRSA